MAAPRVQIAVSTAAILGRFKPISKDLIAALLLRLPAPGSLSKGRHLPGTFHDGIARSKMRKWLELTALAAIASLALTGAAWAQNANNFGCSNASLHGEYAFGVTAYTPAGHPNGPPVVVTGIKVFDGNGTVTQRDYQGDNLAGSDFAPPGQEIGTYHVNSDCTGSMVIYLNVPHASPGVINIRFVISDGGRHIHEVVAQLTPLNSSGPVPTQTSADDWKVALGE